MLPRIIEMIPPFGHQAKWIDQALDGGVIAPPVDEAQFASLPDGILQRCEIRHGFFRIMPTSGIDMNALSDVLGIAPYFDQPEYYIGFNVGGYELGLHPSISTVTPGGSAFAYWGVEDCRAAHVRLLGLGARPNTDVADVGEGILVATVLDPWGNIFGIIENA